MYRVETHNNSKQYFRDLEYESDAIYITANSSLSHMMTEVVGMGDEERWRVLDIETFSKCIYPEWNNIINQIKLKAELRLILLQVKNNLKDDEILKEVEFFEDNLSILHSDFMFLFESGIRRINYEPQEIKFKLLKQIYNKLMDNQQFINVSSELLNFDCFLNIQDKIVDLYIKKVSKHNENKGNLLLQRIKQNRKQINTVYFYNISFLDVNRYVLAEMLKVAGYKIVFRIPYFKNLNVVNKNWEMIYKEDSIFDIHINEKYSKSLRERLKYIEFLEGIEFKDYEDEDISVKNYREIYDFNKDVKNNKVITFYKDSLESCMKRNELNIQNHCYQSAVGRFLFNLYKCKIEDKTIKMNYEIYREMITSGWIEYKEWNGNKLSSFLLDNEDYFSGVRTIDEIIERIEKIKDIEEVGCIFEEQAKNRIKKDKTKAFLSNPFRAFGYVNVEKYNITANYMLEVTLRLKRFLLKALEGKDEVLDIQFHFNNIALLFRSSKYLINRYKQGSEFEKKILKKIFYILNHPEDFGEKIHKGEVGELFYNYLYLNVDEDNEQENDFSIDQLEGIIYRDKLFRQHEKKKLYIADLSYKAYEKYTEKYRIKGKILNDEEIRVIFEKNLTGRNKEVVLQGLYFKEKSNLASESYLKFALANLFINYNGKLEFSWISEFRTNDSKSILLKQIESIYENTQEIHQYLDNSDRIDENEINDTGNIVYDKKYIKAEKKKLPEVVFKDLDFCGNKFTYSSLIEDYPMYYSDFHHKLLFSGIVSLLKNNIEDSYVNICKNIFPLFPQWEEVVKKNILDCEYMRGSLKEYKFFDGINYPKNIDILYLLKSRYVVTEHSRIRNKYKKGDLNSDKYYDEFINEYLDDEYVNNGRHCMMCPHCYVCRKGEFIIDNK